MKELSKETITDSDESGSESTSSPIAPKPPKVSKVSKKSAEKTKSKSKKSTKGAEKPRPRSPTPSSSSAASESASESEDDAATQQNDTSRDRGATIQRSRPSIPAKPYTPPEGFQSMKKHPSKSSGIADSFSNLNGKQIWHITAPAGVSIASMQELALDAVATGQSVLTHKGAEYRLHEDQLGADKTKMLLVPDKQGKTYRRNPLPVVQTFHIEQLVSVPNNATLSTAETETAIQKLKKPLPSKPKHLRMRYRPFGSADGEPETLGSSSEDSEMEDVTLQEPKGASIDREDKKRKRKSDIDGSKTRPESDKVREKAELPRKKVKKAHADSKEASKADDEDDESDTRGRAEKTTSKSSKKRKDDTSQERRVRKEEKKRKKRD